GHRRRRRLRPGRAGGSSPDVGVLGYRLGGGMGWLGRTYGLSANNVQAIEAVLASGELVRADAYHEPDLFGALRGGGTLCSPRCERCVLAPTRLGRCRSGRCSTYKRSQPTGW